MFTEEVGISPLGNDGGALYRARVTDLVTSGRAFARFDGDRVIFKAEVGAATAGGLPGPGRLGQPRTAGPWTGYGGDGGRGCESRSPRSAPAVSLYVNSFNIGSQDCL